MLLGSATCLAVTLALAVYVARGQGPSAVDRATAGWLHENRVVALDRIWRAVALLGGSAVLGAVVLACCILAWRRATPRWVVFFVSSYVGVEALFWSLKVVVDRPRPPFSLRLATASSPSFPSGHAAVAAAVGAALLVAARATTLLPSRAVLATFIGLPLVVGFSRLALDVHWLTDVLGGFSLGLGWVLLCAALVLRDRVGPPRQAEVERVRSLPPAAHDAQEADHGQNDHDYHEDGPEHVELL